MKIEVLITGCKKGNEFYNNAKKKFKKRDKSTGSIKGERFSCFCAFSWGILNRGK